MDEGKKISKGKLLGIIGGTLVLVGIIGIIASRKKRT